MGYNPVTVGINQTWHSLDMDACTMPTLVLEIFSFSFIFFFNDYLLYPSLRMYLTQYFFFQILKSGTRYICQKL